MNREEMMEELKECGAMVPDGYDDCIVGIGRGPTALGIALVDGFKVVEKLMKRDGMTASEAQEFYEYNIAGSYIANGPMYVELLDE